MALAPSAVILTMDEMGRIAPPIVTSVGRDGVNTPKDVFVIQSLLNDRLPRPHSDVPVTGSADIGLVLAIEAYQAVVLGMQPPTGRVDPGSPTYYALASRPLVDETPRPNAVGRLGRAPAEVVEAAVASKLKWSVPAAVTIAQWAVESAWGASMPAGSNNPFGIKAVGDQPSVDAGTREVYNGESVQIVARFRKFESLTEAFEQHGRLLAQGRPYVNAMKLKDDPEAFADALTGVYATDPNYGTTLKYVMRTYGFLQLDQPAGDAASGAPGAGTGAPAAVTAGSGSAAPAATPVSAQASAGGAPRTAGAGAPAAASAATAPGRPAAAAPRAP